MRSVLCLVGAILRQNGTGSLTISVDSIVQHLELITPRSDFDWKPYRFGFVASDTGHVEICVDERSVQPVRGDRQCFRCRSSEIPTLVMALAGVAGLGAFRRRNDVQ